MNGGQRCLRHLFVMSSSRPACERREATVADQARRPCPRCHSGVVAFGDLVVKPCLQMIAQLGHGQRSFGRPQPVDRWPGPEVHRSAAVRIAHIILGVDLRPTAVELDRDHGLVEIPRTSAVRIPGLGQEHRARTLDPGIHQHNQIRIACTGRRQQHHGVTRIPRLAGTPQVIVTPVTQ